MSPAGSTTSTDNGGDHCHQVRPDDAWRGDMAGALGSDDAAYAYSDGWLLDVAAESWVEVPAIDAATSRFRHGPGPSMAETSS